MTNDMTGEGTGKPERERVYAGDVSRMHKNIVIRGENANEFARFAKNILQELSPRGKIQMVIAEKFISAAWKLQRARALERQLLNEQNRVDEGLLEAERYTTGERIHRIRTLKKVDLNDERSRQLIQYQVTLEKTLGKALQQLRAEQGVTPGAALEE